MVQIGRARYRVNGRNGLLRPARGAMTEPNLTSAMTVARRVLAILRLGRPWRR